MIRTICYCCKKNTFYNLGRFSDPDKYDFEYGCSNWDCKEANHDVAYHIDNTLYNIALERLGICGCGDPEEVLYFIKKYIDLKIERDEILNKDDNSSYVRNKAWNAYRDKLDILLKDNIDILHWIVEYLINDKRITTHGGNVSGSWLEDIEFKEILDIFSENHEKDIEKLNKQQLFLS